MSLFDIVSKNRISNKIKSKQKNGREFERRSEITIVDFVVSGPH